MDLAAPFDRSRRRRARAAAAAGFARHAFLQEWIEGEIVARLAALDGGEYENSLILGAHFSAALARLSAVSVSLGPVPAGIGDLALNVVGDEDRLPFADASFDLIVSAGALHAVNDLPGALLQARRALKPGGRFLAGFAGGMTLARERGLFVAAESVLTGRVAARFAPMVDAQAGAALLQRAGFADPVSDVDPLDLRYASLGALLGELRGMGESGLLAARSPLRRDVLARAAADFAALADPDGKTTIRIEIVWLSGRAPAAA